MIKSNKFPEDNILNASSVKKDDSGINKNDYKSLPKPEPNITLNIINEISTIGDSNPLNNNIIYEKMEKKDSNFDDIYFNEYDFFNKKNIFDNLNSELNDYLDNQKNNTLEFLILEPLDILPNDFDDNSKVKKKFKIDKGQNSLGHKKKGNKEECKHTKYDNDNASNKLIIQCMKITTDYINNFIEEFDVGKLYNPNLTNNLALNVVEKKAFLENKIKIYYEKYSKAKHCSKENKDNYINNNREIIEKLYKKKERNIKLIFEIPFCLYLRAFLNDEKNINYENENLELNEDFKTLKDCFNEGKDYYTIEQKAQYKTYIEKLMNGQIYPRKRRKSK